jgi:hypothetical protein
MVRLFLMIRILHETEIGWGNLGKVENIGWEGWRVVCFHVQSSEAGSPHLCRLKTILVGPWWVVFDDVLTHTKFMGFYKLSSVDGGRRAIGRGGTQTNSFIVLRGTEAGVNSSICSSECVFYSWGQWCFTICSTFIASSYFIDVPGGKNLDLDIPRGCRVFIRRMKRISGHLESSSNSITRPIAMHIRAYERKITTIPDR